MCGIAGLVDKRLANGALTEQVIQMTATIEHRGPDSSGQWVDDKHGVALGHRRLAIQDLSASGAQPMHSRSQRYVIVFNGEIYNFKVLAGQLESLGHKFVGHSDTEVVLAAIEQWGVQQAVSEFTGMFAFALWDTEHETLYLGRDRLGEKPLYYGWLGQRFVFSSELKPIIEICPDDLVIDNNALAAYMRYGYIPAPYSIYKNIYKLPPATLLEIKQPAKAAADFSAFADADTKTHPKLYWDVTAIAADSVGKLLSSEADAIEQLDSLLHQVIQQQSIADVPLGTFLSGGIDSTTVTAILQAESSRPVKTFTIGFREDEFNEARFAKKISEHLGTEHNELYVEGKDSLAVIPGLPDIYDEPFADSSQIPTYLISKLARERVTVCLSGDGGDEFFAGYNRYLHTESLANRFARIPGLMKKIIGAGVSSISPGQWNKGYQLLNTILPRLAGKQSNVGLKLHKAANIMQLESLDDIYRYLMSYWQHPEQLVRNSREYPSLFHNDFCRLNSSFIDQAMLWDQLGYLPGDNLTKVDRASMAVSLETRLPLLDHGLVEFSWRVPNSMKVQAGKSKWLLRQVLYKYVPPELIERPKMGFSVPIGAWLKGPLREWAEELLSAEKLDQQGILNTAMVRKNWQAHLKGSQDLTQPLWTVLMFQAWLQKYH